MRRRLMVIGLDCVPPRFVFEDWAEELPNLKRLTDTGIYGHLRSTTPPITVPAWATMVTSKDPGTLGFYGFRNRVDYSYERLAFVTSRWVREKTVWDYLSAAGKTSVVIGVPPSYPPKPLQGWMISCFLTPGPDSEYAYPPELKREIEARFGEYRLDVRNFRTHDKAWLLKEIYALTEQRFDVARYLATTRDWDFFMFVDMGPDRIHHGFWQFMDPQHHRYEPGNPFEHSIREYYRFLDQKVGQLLDDLEGLGEPIDIMVVSDHGAKRMDGGIAINEWLINEGYLTLKAYPDQVTRFTPDMVDWSRTRAWASGGYYARIFLNVVGREPQGTILPEDYERVRQELIDKLEALGNEQGEPIGTRVYRPEELYTQTRNIPPDLIAILGDLYWRSVGSVGYGRGTVWVYENDTGPDDANHDWEGIFIMSGPSVKARGPRQGLQIYDVGATILAYFGLEPEDELLGKPIAFEEA